MKSQNKQGLSTKEILFLLGTVLLTLSIFGYGWWIYQGNNKPKVDVANEKPTLEVYVKNEPRNIQVDYQGGKLANITINWDTKDKSKAYIYVTTNPEEKIKDAIDKANTERTSNGVVNAEDAIGGISFQQQNIGEWVNISNEEGFTTKHKVVLPSEVVQRYMLKFPSPTPKNGQTNPDQYDPFLHFGTRTTADQKITLSDNTLYYFIILVDKDGVSLPYGDPDFTTNEDGPTKGYPLKLPLEI